MKTQKTLIVLAVLVIIFLTFYADGFVYGVDAPSLESQTPESQMKLNLPEVQQNNMNTNNNNQQSSRMSYSEASNIPPIEAPNAPKVPIPQNPPLIGSPQTGYSGIWRDPDTGDLMTSVIAPAPQVQPQQNWPIYIQPSFNPRWYNGYDDDSSYPDWQVDPGWQGYDSGYPPHPGPPPPPPPPPPGYPHSTGFIPYQEPQPLPDGFHPGYRPLYPQPVPPRGMQPQNPNYPHPMRGNQEFGMPGMPQGYPPMHPANRPRVSPMPMHMGGVR